MTYQGRIIKTASPYQGWILDQYTRVKIGNETDGRFAMFYNMFVRKKGSQKAIVVATAKPLGFVCWTLRGKDPCS